MHTEYVHDNSTHQCCINSIMCCRALLLVLRDLCNP
jgi:hypothetical protein